MDVRAQKLWPIHQALCTQIVHYFLGKPFRSLLCESATCGNPQKELSFSIIESNIRNSVYANAKEWLDDMRTYIGKRLEDCARVDPLSPSALVFCHVLREFCKQILVFDLTTVHGWSRRVVSLRNEIDAHFRRAPDSISPFLPFMQIPNHPPSKLLSPLSLSKAVLLLDKPSEIMGLQSILVQDIPLRAFTDPELKAPLRSLEEKTIRLLSGFVGSQRLS